MQRNIDCCRNPAGQQWVIFRLRSVLSADIFEALKKFMALLNFFSTLTRLV